ncbi:MAG: arsinothricin resistance N-acetyltransferase ArsN1 family B [Caulobacterales bacterium]
MRVRVAREADAAAFREIYAPIVETTAISFELTPPSVEEMRSRIAATLRTHPWLAAERDGEVIGYAYAGPHQARAAYRWSVNVTVYVQAAMHRTGAGRALYARLLQLLEQQRFHSAFAGVALPNPASVGLHEMMGFEPLGVYREVGFKLNQWWDVGWWRRALSYGPPSAEPIPFAALNVQ